MDISNKKVLLSISCLVFFMVLALGSAGDNSIIPDEKVTVTVLNVERVNQVGSRPFVITPNEGNNFAILEIEIENTGDSDHHANPNNISVICQNGYSYSYSTATHALDRKEFDAVDVRAGNKAKGSIVFEVPSNSILQELIYDPLFGDAIHVDV